MLTSIYGIKRQSLGNHLGDWPGTWHTLHGHCVRGYPVLSKGTDRDNHAFDICRLVGSLILGVIGRLGGQLGGMVRWVAGWRGWLFLGRGWLANGKQ